MKPPICSVCDKSFFSGGGLVYFLETEDDKKHNKRLKIEGMVGHPSNAFWFCEDHYEYAKSLQNHTKITAFELIKCKFS
jgi:hypothetical protein